MYKRLFWLGVVFVVGLLSTTALALDPMGPPTAGLKQGQWSAGLEYGYSEGDFKHDGDYSWAIDFDDDGDFDFGDTVKEKFELKDGKMNKTYFNLGYGITENWEAFVRVGGADREIKRPAHEGEFGGVVSDTLFDSDTGLSVGFGTKVTLHETESLKVGVLAQASWASVDYSVTYSGVGPYWAVPTEGEIDFWEMQFALGVTRKLSDKFSVYGGPFYYIFDGDYDFKGTGVWGSDDDPMALKGSYDVEQDSEWGGFLGAQVDITENAAFRAECQVTGDAVALGTGVVWRF
jgi:hypothetical protein